ncbi:filamentous hemagglutinin family protein [Pigmentiphaga daeguensis]
MIIWSTEGDIDAGRGAKTLRVPSAPEVLTDIDGFTTMRERSDMSGSGIGTVGDGDLDLIAPEGTVNAGDAGVRVAGNLNIAALHVLNAENIQVKGQSKGLPQVAAVNVGALTNASAAASQAVVAAQDVVQRERVAARQSLPSVFTVRVLGFGGEPASESRGEGREARSGPQAQADGDRRYDPGHLIQLVGLGHNIDPRLAARLTESERRQLERNR